MLLISGYVTDNTQKIRGLSPLHDSGTGSSLGTYGNFEIMPSICPGGFDSCNTTLTKRERFRKNNTDVSTSSSHLIALLVKGSC